MQKKQIILLAAIAIITACQEKRGKWDGHDYYTGKDTIIKGQRYRHSGLGYYYLVNGNSVSKYYPNSGSFQTVSTSSHIQSTSSSAESHNRSSVSRGGFGSTGRSSFHSSGS